MRPWVAPLSAALVAKASSFTNNKDMALRCCVQMVPYGVGDIDNHALQLLAATNADTLRTAAGVHDELRLRVEIASLADLIVELVVTRSLECSARSAASIFTVLIDRLQRAVTSHDDPNDVADRDDPAVQAKVRQALTALVVKTGDRVVTDKQDRWRQFRAGIQHFLPRAADAPLLACILG
jgi:hypothetical protein